MSGNNKMQDTKNINKWINRIEEEKIITKKDITEISTQFSNKQELNETSLGINNLELQEELFQIIQYFDKINIKEIDPIIVSNEKEKLLFKKGFDIIVDKTNDLIFRLLSKGIEWKLLEELVIDYFNNHNINLQEIYNWSSYNQNSANSIFLLGYFNNRGIETSVNTKKAFNLFIKASEKNHILAQYFAGNCYEFGNGTIKNEKLAFEYFEKSANKNFSHGQAEIGYFYENGLGITQNFKKAFYWYEKAANNGNIMAVYNLGRCYKNGMGVKRDCNRAFKLLKQSAEGGYLRGITMLGVCYEIGVGTKIDKQKAFELYQKSANLGELVAQYNLGIMYEFGKGITKDINKAIYWYGKCAEQGDQDAENRLVFLQHY
ncbi:uncharacterized protein OCT59_024335 [Rhizophagus irregularis]|uniref:Skt5p n=2 Tax=Rhizophagus irregularis TaxID=588596 RepID=A0A015KUP6_RHIIW|nr:Skt5p [Rhizophagus irregularis DAOM 197198w]UZO03935.1 hypothetical protein OCT59_024335 [Rhizophagus irregularis]